MRFKEDAAYYGFAAGWSAIRFMPEKAAYATFNQIADGLWKTQGGGVVQLEKNLSRVVPDASKAELRELSRLGMRSYFRYWCDAFRLPDWSLDQINNNFEVYGAANLDQALAKNSGVIVAMPHMGNWDLAGAWAVTNKGPITVVAERLKPEKLFEQFLKFRTDLGMEVIPTGTPHITASLTDRLVEGRRIVGLLADRDLSRKGIEVDLFGEKTKFPAGPAHLALTTGAPLLTASFWYEEDHACARIQEQIRISHTLPTGPDAPQDPGYDDAIKEVTQQIAHRLESGIREHPQDWHMLQKLWLEDLPPRDPQPHDQQLHDRQPDKLQGT